MNVVAFAGGVGGAKLVDGLAACLNPSELTVVVNTGDDFTYCGLRICPDVDTVCYTLAGIANPKTGWGRKDESWNALQVMEQLDGPNWFSIGDKDLGYHLERTRRLLQGQPLSRIIHHFCERFGVDVCVYPMTDSEVATLVYTKDKQVLPFQEYFVKLHCEPQVEAFEFRGIESAVPVPGIMESLENADCVIFCPSNPWVSIDPILGIPGIRDAIMKKLVIAVSPLIGGKAVKGPAAKMYRELGIDPSSIAVAKHYQDLIGGIVIDQLDADEADEISHWSIIPYITDIFMTDKEDRRRLANEVLDFCEKMIKDANL